MHSFSISKGKLNGVWYLHVVATDINGTKISNYVGSIKFDNTNPYLDRQESSGWWKSDNNIYVEYSDTGGSEISRVYYCWTQSNDCSASPNVANGGKIESGTNWNGTYTSKVQAKDYVGLYSEAIYFSFEFDNTGPTFDFDYVYDEEESPLEQIKEELFMEYKEIENEEVMEIVENIEINKVETIEENKEESKVESDIVKPLAVEVIEVVHVPVTNNIDYVLSGLRSSIVIGGTCLFLKERKRINVS